MKVKTNTEQSAAAREASNFKLYLKKEKEVLDPIKIMEAGLIRGRQKLSILQIIYRKIFVNGK